MLEEQPDYNIGRIPSPQERYVAWFDVMGTTAISSRSISEAAIKVFKLHIASIASYEACSGPQKQQLDLYPMMDGVYAISSSKTALMELMRSIFTTLGKDVVDADETHHILIIKAAIAYGPIIRGEQLGDSNDTLEGTDHQDRTMVGLPIVQAFLAENEAPPFGIHIHESARAFAPEGDDPFNYVWWKWFRSHDDEYDNRELARDIRETLDSYYEWSRENSERIDYDTDRIDAHQELANQYLPETQ